MEEVGYHFHGFGLFLVVGKEEVEMERVTRRFERKGRRRDEGSGDGGLLEPCFQR